jgi:insertion element IS1 protein InsB
MKCGILLGQKNKLWVIKAVDRGTRRTVAWVLGGRDTATFQQLYDKVKHLEKCVFYTDAWDAFAAVLPTERHVVGKMHTVTIERDNSNTRHHLARFTRRTKVVSKLTHMVDITLRIWHAVTTTGLFDDLQRLMTCVYT